MAGGIVAAGAVLVVAPVIGGGVNQGPERPAGPTSAGVLKTVPATSSQVAGAKLPAVSAGAGVSAKKKPAKGKRRKAKLQKKLRYSSRITNDAITTEEGKGTFVGIRCPAGMKAIGGGVLSRYVNLLISSSAPNNPKTGKFTAGTWWVAVSNVNIDGIGGTLSWHGIATCVGPLKLVK